MDAAPSVPAVVAVVVACGPGDWLEEALGSLAAQDYPKLSVLVVDAGTVPARAGGVDAAGGGAASGDGGPASSEASAEGESPAGEGSGVGARPLAERVAALLPDAHLARLPAGMGFTQAVNTALEMVEGASHVLICHDDVAFGPNFVRLMLEEAYRSNAGLTCPKFVFWDAPDRLLSVGMGADRLGVVHSLVQPGELDQGQHDGPREVFVAPSGATLVRTDLWRALGGFGRGVEVPGEDLDICWRAQLAGARVVVAPQACARHLEASLNGLRPWPLAASPSDQAANNSGRSGLRSSARVRRERQRLRTLWTCYSGVDLIMVAPVVVAFVLAGSLWAFLRRKGREAVLAPLLALAASVQRPMELWSNRRRAQRLRRASDLTLWRSQSRGSARLRALVRLRLDKGYELAWATRADVAGADGAQHVEDVAQAGSGAVATKAVGTGRWAVSGWGGPLPWRTIAGIALVVAVVLLVGSRNVLSQPFPLIGQLPSSSGGVGSWWHTWWSGTGHAGLGGNSLAPPALAIMGVAGIVALGSAGLVSHVLVLGPLFVGPAGAYLEARRFSSPRGSLVAAVIYAVVPVPYNALSQGHWAGLVAYAAAPWVIGRLGMLGGQAPHPLLHWDAAWFRFLSLGLLVAVAASFSPSMLLLVPFVGLGLCAGSFLAGRGMGGARFLCAALLATLVAFVVLAPWSAEAFRSWASVLGQSTGATQHVSVGQVLRLQTGPFGSGLLGWALLVVAALPLAIGRSWRLAWAARLWVVAITCMAAAWAGSRGWLPVPQLEVLLAPAGAALALSTGVGGACVEHDLLGHRFGWQQFAPAVAAVAAIACVLPLFAWVGGGQWELPASGAESAFAFPAASPGGDYRVLWVGEQSSLPMAPQGSLGQLRFATSLDGLPWAPQLWAPSSPGEAPIVAEDLNWADEGVTTALGHLLAPLAVRYIVVPAGSVPDQLLVALTRQLDLVPVGTDPGYAVFANAAWAPLLSVQTKAAMAGSRVATGSWTGASALQQLDLRASRPVVVGAAQSKATVVENLPASGAAVYGASPLGSFGLSVNGRPVTAQGAFGWAAEWPLPGGNAVVTVSPRGTVSQHLVDLWTFVVWALALGALVSGAHFGLRRQLARAALEVSSRSAERTEIDWSAAWEEGGVV